MSGAERFAHFVLRATALYLLLAAAYGVYRFGGSLGASRTVTALGIPLAVAGALFLATRMAGSVQVTIAMVIVPVALAVVAAELILTVPDRQELNLMGTRMVWRDNRATAISGLRTRGIRAYPFLPPKEFGYGHSALARGGGREQSPFVALGGISGTVTLLCNESGTDVIYTSDERGFNNPRRMWSDSIDVALVGDSFVHGECVAPDHQLAALIRRAIPRTLNVGVAGAGPLSELAAIREYLRGKRPRTVVWFFYEGNDMEDLAAEALTPIARYEDSAYTQGLSARGREIDSALTRYGDSLVAAGPRHFSAKEKLRRVMLLRGLRSALGLDAAARPSTPVHDYDRFGSILQMARADVESWGGRLHFVYLPERRRYDPRMATSLGEEHDPATVHGEVMRRVSAAGIRATDMASVFAAHPHPLSLWIWSRSHYSEDGYRIVADSVLAGLRRVLAPR